MKKRDLVVTGVALVGSVVGMVNMQAAYAGLSCTSATGASVALTCSGTTAGTTYLAQGLAFTGSNGVSMAVSDSATGVQLCGSHLSGKNAYGLSTEGGSIETKTGTAVSAGAGGCS